MADFTDIPSTTIGAYDNFVYNRRTIKSYNNSRNW